MNSAPAVATWLLKRLSSSADSDALIGDLIEDYLQGRSRIWYWRQTFVAIVVSFWREISRHPVLTLRAVVSGWAVIYLYRLLFRPSAGALFIQVSVMHIHEHGFLFGVISHYYWYFIYTSVLAAAGWLVARLFGRHPGRVCGTPGGVVTLAGALGGVDAWPGPGCSPTWRTCGGMRMST